MRNPTSLTDMRAIRTWTFTRVGLGPPCGISAAMSTAEVIAAQLSAHARTGVLYIPRSVHS